MISKGCVSMLLVSGFCLWAGDIEGKVTGRKDKSVVYIDAIAGKRFLSEGPPSHGSESVDVLASRHGYPAGHDGGVPEQ